MVKCSEHGRLCAYRGDELDRCPWCHCLWAHVVTTGYHSCESALVMRNHPERVGQAAALRHEAARNLLRGANSPGVAPTPIPTRKGSLSSW